MKKQRAKKPASRKPAGGFTPRKEISQVKPAIFADKLATAIAATHNRFDRMLEKIEKKITEQQQANTALVTARQTPDCNMAAQGPSTIATASCLAPMITELFQTTALAEMTAITIENITQTIAGNETENKEPTSPPVLSDATALVHLNARLQNALKRIEACAKRLTSQN